MKTYCELECLRVARPPMLLNLFWEKTEKTSTANWIVNKLLGHQRCRILFWEKTMETSTPTICSAIGCLRKYKIIGTSANCSAICGRRKSRSIKRCWIRSGDLGTSITSSGTAVSRCLHSPTAAPVAAAQEHQESAQRADVDGVLQGVPLNLLLRPRVQDRPWPRPLFSVFLVVHEWCSTVAKAMRMDCCS